MRGIEAKVVLEVKERSFDTPAKVVKLFKIGRRATMSGKIGDEEFEITRIKPDTDKAKREVKDRGFIFKGDEIEATIRAQLAAQLLREIPKRFCASGEEKFGINVVFLALGVNEMAKGRVLTVRVFETKEEELVFQGDSGHGIEGIEATVGDKETRNGDRIAIEQGDTGIVFIHKGPGLNDGICIALFQQIEESDSVELMIAAVFGIERDKGIRVINSGDVEVSAVAGQQMQAKFGFCEGETRIEAIEQCGEEIIIEFGALANEGGSGRSGEYGAFGITEVEEAMDFTPDRAFLHGHHEQDKILERKAAVTGKVATGVEDKTVQMILNRVDGAKEGLMDQRGSQQNGHKRYLLESEWNTHFQGRICLIS